MIAESVDHVVQAGVIPFRDTPNGLEVAIVTSSSGDRWLFPKGHVEARESLVDTAAREAFEEAGVMGHVLPRSVGHYSYVKYDRPYCAHLFPMQVSRSLPHWPEKGKRRRKWLGIRQAAARVWHEDLSTCVLALPVTIGALIGGDVLETFNQSLRSVA